MSLSPNNPVFDQTPISFGSIVSRIARLFGKDSAAGEIQPGVFASDTESRRIVQGPGEAAGYGYQQSLSEQAYERMKLEGGRKNAYRDYDLMDSEQPEVSAALDIIAEFATQGDDPKAETFNIHCEDKKTVKYIQEKVKAIALHQHVTPTAREIAKYGCAFWEMVTDKQGVIQSVKPLPAPTMDRNETKQGILEKVAFTQKEPNTMKVTAKFANWQIVNGRYVKTIGRRYGNSLLEPVRRVYKQLQIVQDGMVIQRTYRSHMRYMFMIPVDGMSVKEADEYLKKKRLDFRKKQRLNDQYGKPETYEAPIAANDDFFIGVRKEGVPADVKTVQGQNVDRMDDIVYLQTQLITGLSVPKGLLGLVKDLSSRSTLTEQDVNFARRLYRIQQVIGEMIHEVIRRCMILDGLDPEAQDWTVVLPSISTVDDLRGWQINALKATVALIYGQKLPIVDKQYIYTNIIEMPAEEVQRLTALSKDKLGVAPMPGLAPPGFGAGGGVGSGNSAAGLPASNPMAQMRSRTEWASVSDEDIVHAIRRKIGIDQSEPVLDGELKVAAMLREIKENFGDVAVSSDMLTSAFEGARANGHA